MKSLRQQIEEMKTNGLHYYIYFTNYFNISKINLDWDLIKENNKYYFTIFNRKHLTFYTLKGSSKFFNILSEINNKSMALLNIRNYRHWEFLDIVIQQILQDNEIYIERIKE